MLKQVLIVEDSEACAETLQIALESMPGLETRVIGSPRAAHRGAAGKFGGEIAAIVTDLHLPDSDGFDLIRQLRAEPRFALLPILLISGDTDPLLAEKALAQGVSAFFPKPVFALGGAQETGAVAMLTRFSGIFVLALALVRTATPQSSPDIQKVLDRLDKLENENRMHCSMRFTRCGRSSNKRAPRRQSRRHRHRWMSGSTCRRAARPNWRNRRLRRSAEASGVADKAGMLLFNSFANGKNGGGAEDPVSAGHTATAAASGASLRQTVLGLKFSGPDLAWGGKASGSLYMDFFAGSLAPGNNLLHIRVATLDLNWKNTTITVGQDKPIISPREPMSLAQVGVSPLTGAGNLWDWQPQVRIEQRFSLGDNTGLRAQAGVYQTSESYSSVLPAYYASTLERARPGYEGRLEFFHGNETRRIEIAPGFHVSDTHVAGMSVPSRIGSLDWLLK